MWKAFKTGAVYEDKFFSDDILGVWQGREKSPSYPGYMTIAEIQRRGPQYGNVDMANHHWAGNDHGYGWESHKSLITDKPICG